jgi:hypothetical protein
MPSSGPILSGAGNVAAPRAGYTAGRDDASTVTVQVRETSLTQVAARLVAAGLNVSVEALIQANPQIKDPNHLVAGQDIRMPQGRSDTPRADSAQSEGVADAIPEYLRPPVGDPLARNLAQLRLREAAPENSGRDPSLDVDCLPGACVSEEDPSDPLNPQNPWHDDYVRTQAEEWAAQRLQDLGMPPEPPNITQADVKKLQGTLAQHTPGFGVSDGVALVGIAAGAWEAIEKGALSEAAKNGLVGTLNTAGGLLREAPLPAKVGLAASTAGAFFLGASIRAYFDAPGQARDAANIMMERDMALSAMQLVNDKFPQSRPLNQHGHDLAAASYQEWKDRTEDKLNPILKKIQLLDNDFVRKTIPLRETGISDPEEAMRQYKIKLEGELDKAMQEGTADLANSQMKIFYDPRNWNEPKT